MKKLQIFLISSFLCLFSVMCLGRVAFADMMPFFDDPCYKLGNCPKSLGEKLDERRTENLEHLLIGVLVVVVLLVVTIVIIKIRKKK